jgi:glycosyltransferase involved in cell wall biosynthesis
VHYEGISHGRDEAHGIKAFQIRNQRIFRARWQSVLARDHLPNGSHVMRARDRAKQRDVILLIDHYVPEPDRDAGSRTTLCMIQALQSLGLAIKFWPHNLHYSPGYTDALQDLGVEVIYGCDGDAFRDWLADNAEDLTFVLLCRPQVALDFLPELKRYPHIGRLYYGADLHFRRMRLQAQVEEDRSIGRQAAHMEKLERCVWRDVDVALYPSDEEAAAVRALEPRVVARTLLPYCFSDFAMQRRPPSEPAILFVAGFAHPPNRHAALWFVEQVLPAIRARVPAVQLSIVGSNPTAEVRELASAGVRVHANVSEQVLREYYACARVAVVPLHYGAGVKLKVVEALREGLPLVTTSIGAQGLPDLKDIASIEDDAASFADAVCRLLTDDLLWARRSAAQVDYAAARYSHAAFRASLADALAQVPSRCATRLAS